MDRIRFDKPDVRERLARASADANNPADAERICGECGVGLGATHGNRKYHVDCVKAIRSRTASANSARYRNRKRSERQAAKRPEPPADYRSHQVRVRGVALPGTRVLELRGALNAFLAGLIEQDLALRRLTLRQVAHSPERMALRTFVDDGLTLVALLDTYLPGVSVDARHDLLAVIDAAVKRHIPLVRS